MIENEKMKFGYFDDLNREYVIETPSTPFPWINYLGSDKFFSLISHTAGGYSFYQDALLRRITRYRYNNVPQDVGARAFYIKDGPNIWSPSWKPVQKELTDFQCRHGLGYTQISGELSKLKATLLFMVPLDDAAEIQHLTLVNKSEEPKKIQLYSYVEFCLWNALDDMTNFQRNLSTGEVEVDGSTIYHITEYRERRNHYAYYTANHPINGFDTDRNTFLGLHRSMKHPVQVDLGISGNSKAQGWAPVASHRIDLKIEPGEKKDIVFILGYAILTQDDKFTSIGSLNTSPANEIISKYNDSDHVSDAMGALKEHWDRLLAGFQVLSSDEQVDRMVNIWNQYQCLVTFHLARSASYFEAGIGRGIGFRDTNQDLLGCVHLIPNLARQRILDVAATQLNDGSAYHQYQPLTKKGNNNIGGQFNDDPLWLIVSTAAYIKETGDWDILKEEVPFDNDWKDSDTLFVHLMKSFYYTVDHLGPHGLPLIGRADWNDCLNLNAFSTSPDESFQTCDNKDGRTAESIFIAALFIYACKDLEKICYHRGGHNEREKVLYHMRLMEENVIQSGWDGEWFLRAYDDSGNKIGSSENREGQIYIEPQGFCSMAGIGVSQSYPQQALDSVAEHLDTPYGIMILNPPYSKYDPALGEISSYPPGYKENGGIFCHNNPWIIIAEAMQGNARRAFDYYRKFCPAYLEEISDLHLTEPYVYSQMIAGKAAVNHGQAKNSWLTGTAAWSFVAISQWILGIRPDFDGLIIDPCIPSHWPKVEINRTFRGCRIKICIENPDGCSKNSGGMEIDGQWIATNCISDEMLEKKELMVRLKLNQG